jgi:hypothetical protein
VDLSFLPEAGYPGYSKWVEGIEEAERVKEGERRSREGKRREERRERTHHSYACLFVEPHSPDAWIIAFIQPSGSLSLC